MSAPTIIDTLESRGFISQITETGLREESAQRQVTVYCGFDPTAPSLHIGHAIQALALGHFQRHGHRVIALVGGGTGLIGDPSGRSDERKLLSKDDAAANVARIKRQLSGFLSFEGDNPAIIADNYDWLGDWRLVDFLRDIGKHFTINMMLAKDSVRSRLEDREQGLSFTEFSYMLLQSADYLHLHQHYGCTVQIGGSDQWGNITAGIDLVRRVTGHQVHGITSALLTSSSGQKFGKSAGNALWLDPAMTSPYQAYQFWMNADDRDVVRYLKILTMLDLDEIGALEQGVAEHPERREAQRRLAYEFTAIIHGAATARSAQIASDILFGREGIAPSEALRGEVVDLLEREIPVYRAPRAELAAGVGVVQALVAAGLAPSNSQARRLLQQHSVALNGVAVSAEANISSGDLLDGRAALLRSGKRSYALVVADE
jgi:tyrosyl-tRNA synthetase